MNKANLYLKNCKYVEPFSGKIFDTDIEVESGNSGKLKILPLGTTTRDFIDCKGKIVTRSFVNAHHHIYSALARGMPAPEKLPRNFHEILQYVWWKLDRSLTREMIEVSAQVTAIESLKSGVTFIIDHHSSPESIEDSLWIINSSLKKSGIDSIVCYELSDRDGDRAKKKAIEESERTLKSGIPSLVGLHASFTVSDDLMKNAVELAGKYNSGIHIHVAESPTDNEISLRNYGKRAVERLKHSGVLEFKKTLLAHCIHINDKERDLIKNSPAMVVRNPRSNLNNGVGIFDDRDLDEKILLGTDGINSDILEEFRLYFLLNGGKQDNSPRRAYNSLRRAENYLAENSFLTDRENDLVILNYENPTDLNNENFYSHLIFGISSGNIETVISGGKVVMDKGKFTVLDEESVMVHAVELSRYLWEKMRK